MQVRRSTPVRRPDGFAIRRKKRFDLLSGGFVIPYPIDMPANAWLLGIANPQSIKRLGHFLTADCKSAGTPNGGKDISGTREFFILNNLFNTKNLAISIICFIFAQKQNVWQ